MKKIFIAVCMFLSFVFIGEADIKVWYRGTDNVHLDFSCWVPLHTEKVELKARSEGGAEEVLFSTEDSGVTISGKIHHTGLSNGAYTYQMWRTYKPTEGSESVTEKMGNSVSVNIDGKTIGGYGNKLLFDEIINSPAIFVKDVNGNRNTLTVPEGITLTVNANLEGEAAIYVYGTIVLKSGISFSGRVCIMFYCPVDIEGITGNPFFFFNASSSGSTIKNCSGHIALILYKNAKDIYVEDSEIDFAGIVNMSEGSSLKVKNSTIAGTESSSNFSFSGYGLITFEAEGTTFLEGVNVYGGSPIFKGCEVCGKVNIEAGNTAEFTDCVFGSEVFFADAFIDSQQRAKFSNNSFVGRVGPTAPGKNEPISNLIDLGVNYYGNKKPTFESAQTNTFLTREIYINKNVFNVTSWNTSGPEMKNQKKLPSFWLNGYVIGQNCLSHNPNDGKILLQGRETLLSLDVATNYTNVSGVKFKAIFDGQEIQPINPDVVLHRDISKLGNNIFWGNTTVNFILPPTYNTKVNLIVKMDTTSISGFDDAEGKEEREILNLKNLAFTPPYARNLNIVIQPIGLLIGDNWKKAPKGKEVEKKLKALIPAMLPISRRDLFIWTEPAKNYEERIDLEKILGKESKINTTILLNSLASRLALDTLFTNSVSSELTQIDFVVAILPHGILGEGETGANLTLRRGVIFVDEKNPDAALHEIGHGIGLYTDKEQYKQYPEAGLPVEGLTAFINENSANNLIQGFGKNRFLHFPGKGQSWYKDRSWYDIMGNCPMMWPIPDTSLKFKDYFTGTLGTQETKSINYKQVKVQDGYRRIFVSGEIRKFEQSGGYYYKFIPGTISSFDITEIATGTIDTELHSSVYTGSPEDDCELRCYDGVNSEPIYTKKFTTVSPYKNYDNVSDWPEETTFCATFDIPNNTKIIKIFRQAGVNFWEKEPVFVLTSSPAPEINITSLTSGTKLSDSVDISWTPQATKQAGGTMQYVVMASPDGGTTWFPISLPTTSTSITIPTDFLPASDKIVFKVVGSSGLGETKSAEVSNLKRENRKPEAIIVSPKDGWVGNTETKWLLKGYGSDSEDGIIPTGEWTIDKKKTEETEVVLSSGTHTIKFKVTDSGGLTDETSVVVEVKETIEEIDLSLNEGCLTLITPNSDPLNTSPVVWLEKDGIHRAILKIQNVGIQTSFTASLYLKRPSDTEKLLASKIFTPDAFEEVVLSETFIVSTEGEYTIKGKIEIPKDAILQDKDISNNEWTWKYQTQPNKPVIGVIPEELDFGEVKEITKGLIIITNYGNADLIINSLKITGKNATDFSIDQSIVLPITIPADKLALVPIYFSPTSTGKKEAKLEITSNANDTENPAITIKLTGNCIEVPIATGDINGSGKVDISDVILCLRMAINLDPVNTSKADINRDGKVDISDVILILRKAIGLS